jgi:hypothetical protein
VLTLWDLLTQRAPARPEKKKRRVTRRVEIVAETTIVMPAVINEVVAPVSPSASMTMRERYEWMTREMLGEHSVRVRKWRSSMSGVAWQVTYADGTISRLIEAPRPRGPMSAAVFLHEIGHHAIGFHRYSPRCLEEHMAWMFSIEMMRRYELNITDAVHRRVRQSMRYAIAKARRRGIKQVPPELAIYLTRPERIALGVPLDADLAELRPSEQAAA